MVSKHYEIYRQQPFTENPQKCRLKRDEWVNSTWHCAAEANLFGLGYEVNMGKTPNNKYKGITWGSFMGMVTSMKKIEMKIRPKSFDKNGMF